MANTKPIKWLRDILGNKFFPVTHMKAVRDDDGNTLSCALTNINEQISTKQDTLVSGTNIKMVNGNSLLGSGNLCIAINESNLVHKTGDETISGIKNFDETINAGRITVCGEDVVRTSDLATKLDKLTSSTDNAVVRFDGTTGNIQNSGVTINDSNQVTATKFITCGGTNKQFVSGDGSLVNQINTSLLVEPDFTQSGNTTMTMWPLVNTMAGNALVLLKASQIIIEQTIDGGETWTSGGYTDAQKQNLFLGTDALTSVAIPRIDGVRNKLCGVRITITGMNYNVPANTAETDKYQYWNSDYVVSTERYCSLNSVYLWVTSVNDRIRTRVYCASGNNPNNWVAADRRTNAFLSGLSGGDVITLTGKVFGGGTTQAGNYWNYRFVFFTDGADGGELATTSTTSGQAIYRIQGFGQNHWTNGNKLMAINHLYTWDTSQNAIFPAKITSTGFVKSGGTSSQFLKADGSVDSNIYLTTAPVTSVNGQTGAITGLAPLASPALTGTPTAPTATSGTKTDQIATTCFVQKAVAASAGSDVNWNNDKSCLTKTLNGTTTSIVNATTITQAGAPSIIADASCTCAQKNRRAYSARYIDSTFATIADVEDNERVTAEALADLSARQEVVIIDFDYSATTWDDTQENPTALSLQRAGHLNDNSTLYNSVSNAVTSNKHVILQDQDGCKYYFILSFFGVVHVFASVIPDFDNNSEPVISQIMVAQGDIDGSTQTQIIQLKSYLGNINEIEETTAAALNDLHSSLNNKLSWDDTTNTLNQSSNLPTSNAVYNAIQTAIQGIPTPMQFKGSLGTGGTYTASTLPAASSANKGWTVKVITAGTYKNIAAKVGDVLVSDGSAWVLIPSGDEPSGTVTSVGLSMPTGFSVSGSPVTSSGTLAVSMASGYSIPTTTQMTTWSNKQDAISDLQTIRSNACTGASKVSNVQSDWNATSGLAQILNKPTVISSIGYSAPAGYLTVDNTNAVRLTMCTSSGRKLNIGDSAWQITSTTEPSSSTDKDLVAPTWSAMASALSGKANSATTLAGYGITDAKIANGTITLGSNSITPLTSHQTLKTINSTSLVGSGNISIPVVSGGSGVSTVPTGGCGASIVIGNTTHVFVSNKMYCSSSDVNVAPSWSAMATCLAAVRSEISGSAVTIYTGTSAPASSTGVNGDIYIQTSCA